MEKGSQDNSLDLFLIEKGDLEHYASARSLSGELSEEEDPDKNKLHHYSKRYLYKTAR